MKYLTLILLCAIIISSPAAYSQKRGLAYGYNSPDDLAVLSPAVSWWYNWAVEPESAVAGIYGSYGFEFCPMAWNGSFNETRLRGFLANHPETKYLLAFNEPNFLAQANMTPTAAAAHWPRLEAIAKDYNLKIVGPAMNYCGSCVQENGVTYNDPFTYLDDFFKACPGCRVDYIAAHCYMNHLSALQWYINQYKKYGKPIWLTEFAGWEPNGAINTQEDQINFMISAVDYLETDTSVFRYSWFIGRGGGITTYPFIDILGANGKLTPLGEAYTRMPVHNPSQLIKVPGTIQNENYNTMSGIQIQKTADVSGFANVYNIEAGDWLEYRIEVGATADFDFRFRYATIKASSADVLVDGVTVFTQIFPNTNGLQTWETVMNKIHLTSGIHTLRLRAMNDGLSLNWVHIGDGAAAIDENKTDDRSFSVFPNPGNGNYTVRATAGISELRVLNLLGIQVANLPYSTSINLGNLASGIYFLKAIDHKGRELQAIRISVIR